MRKLIFAINLTVDGCCDHTKVNGDEDIHNYHARLLHQADTIIYGRKTYQLMVPFWPDMAKNNSGPTKSLNDFAQAFDAIKNVVVFSRSLEKAEGKNTSIVRGNLLNEIRSLKQQEGKNMLTGGVDIPSQLIQLGLIDEYHFVIQPTIAGQGRRLLTEVIVQENLKLVDAITFPSGTVALRYEKR